MPLYDLMLLLDPSAPSDRQEAILRDVQTLLESGGKVVGTYDWGARRMAFEIDHRPEAAYHLLQFETASGGALLERVDHSLKIMDGVLRHRIVRLKAGSPPPPMPRPEGRREAAPAGDGAAAAGGEAPAPLPPEEGQPADAPALAGTAAAAQPAAPSDAPAPAPAETPPPPDTAADQEAGPAGGGGDDEAPSGPAAG